MPEISVDNAGLAGALEAWLHLVTGTLAASPVPHRSAVMAKVFSEGQPGADVRHRADEIHVHPRERRKSSWVLLAVLALVALAIAVFAYRQSRAVSSSEPVRSDGAAHESASTPERTSGNAWT